MANGPTRALAAASWTEADYPSIASDSTSKFIPQVWAGKLLENFYNATVFGEIANTDFEGDIKGYGDSVIIRTTPSITISNYTIGQKLTYQTPEKANVELQIDQAKSFAFAMDDVDEYQSDLRLMDEWSMAAGEEMKVAIDTDILGNIFTSASAANKGNDAGAISGGAAGVGYVLGDNTTPVVTTKSNIIDYIVDHGAVLDEQNCPQEGRWMVLPAWACARIKTSDLKDASLAGDGTSILRNGLIGMIDRFKIYSSNSVATTQVGEFDVMAGHKKAVTFAAQMTKMETLPNPDSFGSLVRGLNVYGYEVVQPTLLTHGVISKA